MKSNTESISDRMKENYENRSRFILPRRTYTIIRVDGKAFHTYTKGLQEPFDSGLIEDMNLTASFLCKNMVGARFAYVQSDEISVLLTDFGDPSTQAWFDNNVQKMASIAASMATAKFNQLRMIRGCNNCDGDLVNNMLSDNEIENFRLAMFDARVFQIPQKIEVENYFIWRQQDATRNSIQSVARSLYSQAELNKRNTNEMQEMIFQKGVNWNDYTSREKRGALISKVTYVNGKNLDENPTKEIFIEDVVRTNWEAVETPVFTQERDFLSSKIPNNY